MTMNSVRRMTANFASLLTSEVVNRATTFVLYALVARYLGIGRGRIAYLGMDHTVRLGERTLVLNERDGLYLNFRGPKGTFPSHSVLDLVEGRVPAHALDDRIVLLGITHFGHDRAMTPFGDVVPAVEIQATAIDNILMQEFMTKPKWSMVFDMMAIIILGTLTGVALPRMSAVKGIFFAAGLFLVYIFIARFLFVDNRVWLNIVYPLLALAVNYTALTVYYYLTEERERKKIKGTFRHYVAPLVVEEMLKDPDMLQLGGEEKVLTVLFCDLEGFTSYSEKYAPHEMITFLSEYFEKMS